MAETTSHKQAKGQAAGRSGKKEMPISGNRRLDALSPSGKTATEVERSGNMGSLKAALAVLCPSLPLVG